MRESHAKRVKTRAILAWPCVETRAILAWPCVILLAQRAKKCDTNHIPRATAYPPWPIYINEHNSLTYPHYKAII